MKTPRQEGLAVPAERDGLDVVRLVLAGMLQFAEETARPAVAGAPNFPQPHRASGCGGGDLAAGVEGQRSDGAVVAQHCFERVQFTSPGGEVEPEGTLDVADPRRATAPGGSASL